ncbi:MAG: phosphate ABC transporter substrate-binding protein PstS [Lamprobacter sp.]|uniref:phosphate ABC transporter substrate-binding protein PstS n=1 Tax=Lamprobacter sp. TaxID=3100796 RepID=UPI002B25749D|nr:phosphate ABC transporter substrate-binding protein PstS [Lamprobacter sp.]MEA3639576.1 phosphate ABC transporter substrate-binding protein PstS [Lamprobacter sp.]
MHRSTPLATFSLSVIVSLSIMLGGCEAEQSVTATEPAQPVPDNTILAAGSSFAAPIFNQWFSVYGAEHTALSLSYDSIGSGAGIERFLAGSADIGTTDAPLNADEVEQAEGEFVQLPVTGGMIAIAYNLPDYPGPLNLPRDVYTEIFLGQAFRWDDPRIAAANPGMKLPPRLIQVVGRRDSSGTTFAFTHHLAAISDDWANGPGVGKRIDWPGGAMEATGNEGVAQRIKITQGSIGYVEAGFAQRLGLSIAWLENEAGGFVLPSVETGRRGLADGTDTPPSDLTRTIPDPKGARSYPIVTYTWALASTAYDTQSKTAEVKALLRWILTDGQQDAEALGYVPLPENMVQAALNVLEDRVGGPKKSLLTADDAD